MVTILREADEKWGPPAVRVRQWVLTLPPRLLALDHALTRAVVAVFVGAVQSMVTTTAA